MNKKLISLALISMLGFSLLGCSNQKEKLQEEMNVALELLQEQNEEKAEKFYIVEDTNVIIEELQWETNKTKVAFDKHNSAFIIVWDMVIDLGIECNNKANSILIENGYENINVLYFVVDENDEIIAIIYDEEVYYDEVYKINNVSELEEKFGIDIHIK